MPDSWRHLAVERRDRVTLVRLDRPEKRNAVNDALIQEIDRFFRAPPAGTRVVVVHGAGEHFCAGLDLSEHKERDAFEVMQHSRFWQGAFDAVQLGGLPVVAALHGGVIGGGLELAAATHVRIAERSAFYQMPEGQRGIFVGGGASVRVSRIIGMHRVVEMMLTGRRYDAEEGLRLGLSHYLVENGEGLAKALALAEQIAGNAQLSTWAVLNSLARIEDMGAAEGFYTESLTAALVQTGAEAKQRLEAFLQRKPRRK
jgi:(methylthio)acryloyl-CoA hydratase